METTDHWQSPSAVVSEIYIFITIRYLNQKETSILQPSALSHINALHWLSDVEGYYI